MSYDRFLAKDYAEAQWKEKLTARIAELKDQITQAQADLELLEQSLAIVEHNQNKKAKE